MSRAFRWVLVLAALAVPGAADARPAAPSGPGKTFTTGGVTILVSHRFSTVRMADLILVMGGGRVVESGSHEELLDAGGPYAQLYRLQSKAYR